MISASPTQVQLYLDALTLLQTDGTIPPFPPPCAAQHVDDHCPDCAAWYAAIEHITYERDCTTSPGREIAEFFRYTAELFGWPVPRASR